MRITTKHPATLHSTSLIAHSKNPIDRSRSHNPLSLHRNARSNGNRLSSLFLPSQDTSVSNLQLQGPPPTRCTSISPTPELHAQYLPMSLDILLISPATHSPLHSGVSWRGSIQKCYGQQSAKRSHREGPPFLLQSHFLSLLPHSTTHTKSATTDPPLRPRIVYSPGTRGISLHSEVLWCILHIVHRVCEA